MRSAVIPCSMFSIGTTPPIESVMAHLLGANTHSIPAIRAEDQPLSGSCWLPYGVGCGKRNRADVPDVLGSFKGRGVRDAALAHAAPELRPRFVLVLLQPAEQVCFDPV